MEEFYANEDQLFVAIDCIIFGFDGEKLKLLLIKRNFEPKKGSWSLMGGFLRAEENLAAGAQRILKDLTGLEQVYMKQLETYGDLHRDPVSRTLSIAYFALINIREHDEEQTEAQNGQWFSFDEKPNLIFDHNEMVEDALAQLRQKAAVYPIGFELLPEKFTIPQLHKLYEAIYGQKLDRRNFSRKIISMKLLIDSGEKDLSGSTKKATFYHLDQEKYKSYSEGFQYFIPKGFI